MPENALPENPNDRYNNRLERRLKVLELLEQAGFGIYLPPDSQQRKEAFKKLARLIARERELPKLAAGTLDQASAQLETRMEAMQKHLPTDVQYRNRIRSRNDW